MGRITSFSKQVIVFFLVTALIIRPTFASNLGGWTLGGGVAQGASTVYTGTKNVIINGADYIKKGTAKITPTASGVAKVLARGAAGAALSVAVEQLIGAVDWVLDPANNQVVYYKDPDSKDCSVESCTGPYIWRIRIDSKNYDFSSPNASAGLSLVLAYYYSAGYTNIKPTLTNTERSETNVRYIYYVEMISPYIGTDNRTFYVGFERVVNPNADPEAEERERKTIPLETVAQQVISNAESGDTNAQVATTAAAADIVAEAETDNTKARPIVNQLEQSASTENADADAQADANTATGSQTQNPSKPDTTDLKLEFPAFCGWAPVVCEAAQVVISFPQTLTNWWETGKSKAEEWATSISEAWTKVKEEYSDKPEENTDTELDIPDQSDPNINTDLSFGGSCPASRSVPGSFFGIHTEIEFSFQWFCEVASIAKPVVISISAFAAALIVAGVRTEDD